MNALACRAAIALLVLCVTGCAATPPAATETSPENHVTDSGTKSDSATSIAQAEALRQEVATLKGVVAAQKNALQRLRSSHHRLLNQLNQRAVASAPGQATGSPQTPASIESPPTHELPQPRQPQHDEVAHQVIEPELPSPEPIQEAHSAQPSTPQTPEIAGLQVYGQQGISTGLPEGGSTGLSTASPTGDATQRAAMPRVAGPEPSGEPAGAQGVQTASRSQPDDKFNTMNGSINGSMTGPVPQRRAVASAEEQAAYDAAFELLMQSHYADAIIDFHRMVDRFPRGALVDDALYWIGEAYYAGHDYAKALNAFTTVLHQYPKSQRMPETMLKLGSIYVETGRAAEARQILNQVIAKYPGSRVAISAKTRLNQVY